jgi:hypothetical protein
MLLPVVLVGCLGGDTSARSHHASSGGATPTGSLVTGIAQSAGGTVSSLGGNVHPYRFTELVVAGRTDAGSRFHTLVTTNGMGKLAVRLNDDMP